MTNFSVVDFHTHSFLSDGVLGHAELARRVWVDGYGVLGIADHVDHATLAGTIKSTLETARCLNGHLGDLVILPGVEITHVPPALIGDMAQKARDMGASHIVVHGETVAEPVAPGTNLAAIRAGADILAHPGLLTDEEAALAAEHGVYIELSGRKGHSLTNGRVALLARKHGAKLLVNSDGHAPGDYLSPERQKTVALGAGLNEEEFESLMAEAFRLAAVFKGRLA
jgi:histidinol phosphatase-like PHP family hydrolase